MAASVRPASVRFQRRLLRRRGRLSAWGNPFSVQCCPSYNLSVCFAAKAGLRHPASAALRLRLAGRCPTATPCFRHWRRSSLLPLLGEPLASRETLSWTMEAQYGAKWRASLQRAAASGRCTLSSCRESRQRSTITSDKSSFVRPAWAWPICQGLPYQGSWQSRQALTERFFRARAL